MTESIKFLVDENVDFPVIRFLRTNKFEVTSISEECPSLDDINILKKAFDEGRVLITNDKDFGNLVFKLKLKSMGVILFRLNDQSSKAKIRALSILLDNYLNKLLGSFIVLSEGSVRIREL